MGLRAVIIRCPNCNANLEIVNTVPSVTCSYCGVVSRIQAKTMMFEVPKTLPPAQEQSPQQRLDLLQQLTQLQPIPRFALRHVLIPMFVFAAAAGVIFFFAVRAGGGGFSSNKMLWGGHPPVLLDVDGDGTPDIVGIARYVVDDDRSHLAAYSGKTGAPLWESESLGSYSSLGQFQLVAVGASIVIASDRGSLVARDGKTGAVKWNLAFNEKIDILCAAGSTAVMVGTADDKWSRVDDQGVQQPGNKLTRLDRDYSTDGARDLFDRVGVDDSAVCVPLDGPWYAPGGMIALKRWHDLVKIDGMDVELLLRRPGSKDTIGVGVKTPGTRVPMIAKIDGAAATWTAAIPGSDPLVARFENKHLAATDTAVFALYKTSNPDGARMTAFEIATGKRLWEREVRTGAGFVAAGIVVAGDVVLLSTWQDLRAYSIADGKNRFTIGAAR